MPVGQKIIVATDELSPLQLVEFAHKVGGRVAALKVHNYYDSGGPEVVSTLGKYGARVFVDFKLYDIPNTVAKRTRALSEAGAHMLTVHASGGIEMMRAAVENAGEAKILAVTVLTSFSEEQVFEDYGRPAPEVVEQLALNAAKARVHGIVCSPQEVALLRYLPELKDIDLVVPGIRSAGKDTHDQKRIGTPAGAIRDGATYLVIGRQITQAGDPLAALEEIEREIEEVLTLKQGERV